MRPIASITDARAHTALTLTYDAQGRVATQKDARDLTTGAECALKPTTAPGGGRALAAEAVREGFEIIVAAGGDGTLNEVLNWTVNLTVFALAAAFATAPFAAGEDKKGPTRPAR